MSGQLLTNELMGQKYLYEVSLNYDTTSLTLLNVTAASGVNLAIESSLKFSLFDSLPLMPVAEEDKLKESDHSLISSCSASVIV